MTKRQPKRQEWIPWYRRGDCKADLTEIEKRELDAFRMQKRHPAAQYVDLPEEVQSYIGLLELEVYDLKQEKAAAKPMLASAVGAVLIFLSYRDFLYSDTLGYALGILLLIVPWLIYRREWRKNAAELLPDQEVMPNPTDERIRNEWESAYIARRRRASSD